MKIKNIACAAALLLASLSATQAQTTLADWTFDSVGILAPVPNPAPATGSQTLTAYAETVGMTNTLTTLASTGAPDVIANPAKATGSRPVGTGTVDSTPALPDAWRVRALGGAGGNGWDCAAPVGTQGAQFHVSTLGYYDIKLTFDITATSAGEAFACVEYTTDGLTWNVAPLAYPANPNLILNNSVHPNGTNDLVIGSYLAMTNAFGNQTWYTNVTADFTGNTSVNNNTNFAVRIVNAAQGANCISTALAGLNNTSGNWSMDNVAIVGNAVQTITDWTFESESNAAAIALASGTLAVYNNPVPETGSGTALALGMDNTYTYADNNGNVSVSTPDVLLQAGSSTPNQPDCWRIRGQNTENGWNTEAPIGSQGVEFDVSTVGYNTILVTFDMYYTTQGEAKFQAQYTTDGWITSNSVPVGFSVGNSSPTSYTNKFAGGVQITTNTYIYTNDPASMSYSPNTASGAYFYQTNGQDWFNGITMDLTGVAGVTNNPNFGIRIVNASTGADVLAPTPTLAQYNNSSGNWRFDNVSVKGQFAGPPAPAITPDPSATVDHPFTNIFSATATNWQYAVTNIMVNGNTLPLNAYSTNIAPGQIIFYPAQSTLLQAPGNDTLAYQASGGYALGQDVQTIGSGVPTKIGLSSQVVGPTGNGGTLVQQPAVGVVDQYGNAANSAISVTASVGGSGGWTLGGQTTVTGNGLAYFTNLSATINGLTAVPAAYITFTVSGTGITPPTTNSATFAIAAPPTPYTPGNVAVMQIDAVSLDTTFSILELNSTNTESTPVNVIPISATGTNGLRMSSSGSTGRLANSSDGTLLCFAGFLDQNSVTVDETANLIRACGALNYTNAAVVPWIYTVSVGSSQARGASTADNTNFIIADKNAIYIDSTAYTAEANNNNRAVRVYAGLPTSCRRPVRTRRSMRCRASIRGQRPCSCPASLRMLR